jgi:uncharacterized protein YukE
MGAGRGADHYYSAYGQEELWQMLIGDGDSWSVEQVGEFWQHARQELEVAVATIDAGVAEVVEHWWGLASSEYQAWIGRLQGHAAALREGMAALEQSMLPSAAAALDVASARVREAALDPAYWAELNEWIEDHRSALKGLGERRLRQAHRAFRDEQHRMLAEMVADLGDRYQEIIADGVALMPNLRFEDLPGADVYQQPNDSVLGLPATFPQPPADAIAPDDHDEGEHVDDDGWGWTPMSYTDVDRAMVRPRFEPEERMGLFGPTPMGSRDTQDWEDAGETAAAALGRRLAREEGDREDARGEDWPEASSDFTD